MITKRQKENVVKKFIKWLEENGILFCKDTGEPYEGYYVLNESNESIIERFMKEEQNMKQEKVIQKFAKWLEENGVPNCCENVKYLVSLHVDDSYFTADCKEEHLKLKNEAPKWKCKESGESNRYFDVEYCPCCGKKLPKVRLRKNQPKKIVVISDGGYYCDTCGERLTNCWCSPPEHRWESVK
jgi:hypothetical protein